jgi:hypothetical protein
MDLPFTPNCAGRSAPRVLPQGGRPLPRTLEDSDWARIGPIFELLYSPNGYDIPLKETISLLEIIFGFQAT